ncbi:uncharacterized protein LOC128227385 [Mya arenaria]|uniref:uncharacterized protein LOC128227385 n=1 Tax=Mya arenaria TaxID=6604 RepID=UPI0022E12817|nr:uncharacterized protein LOC128227385 [Mya arenaria]
MPVPGKRKSPKDIALQWVEKGDPDGFSIDMYGFKGRGIKTLIGRDRGEFLLHYTGEKISGDEGERRERRKSTGYRFFFDSNGQKLCVDASKESGRLGRLVNHGNKKEANSIMKHVDGHLFLFALRNIKAGEELLYDYGLKDLPWMKDPATFTTSKGSKNKKGERKVKKREECEGDDGDNNRNNPGINTLEQMANQLASGDIIDAPPETRAVDNLDDNLDGKNVSDEAVPKSMHELNNAAKTMAMSEEPEKPENERTNHFYSYVKDPATFTTSKGSKNKKGERKVKKREECEGDDGDNNRNNPGINTLEQMANQLASGDIIDAPPETRAVDNLDDNLDGKNVSDEAVPKSMHELNNAAKTMAMSEEPEKPENERTNHFYSYVKDPATFTTSKGSKNKKGERKVKKREECEGDDGDNNRNNPGINTLEQMANQLASGDIIDAPPETRAVDNLDDNLDGKNVSDEAVPKSMHELNNAAKTMAMSEEPEKPENERTNHFYSYVKDPATFTTSKGSKNKKGERKVKKREECEGDDGDNNRNNPGINTLEQMANQLASGDIIDAPPETRAVDNLDDNLDGKNVSDEAVPKSMHELNNAAKTMAMSEEPEKPENERTNHFYSYVKDPATFTTSKGSKNKKGEREECEGDDGDNNRNNPGINTLEQMANQLASGDIIDAPPETRAVDNLDDNLDGKNVIDEAVPKSMHKLNNAAKTMAMSEEPEKPENERTNHFYSYVKDPATFTTSKGSKNKKGERKVKKREECEGDDGDNNRNNPGINTLEQMANQLASGDIIDAPPETRAVDNLDDNLDGKNVSDEAVPKSMHKLNNAAKTMAMSKEPEKPENERTNHFYSYVKDPATFTTSKGSKNKKGERKVKKREECEGDDGDNNRNNPGINTLEQMANQLASGDIIDAPPETRAVDNLDDNLDGKNVIDEAVPKSMHELNNAAKTMAMSEEPEKPENERTNHFYSYVKVSKKYVSKAVAQEIHEKALPFIRKLQEADEKRDNDNKDEVEENVGAQLVHLKEV